MSHKDWNTLLSLFLFLTSLCFFLLNTDAIFLNNLLLLLSIPLLPVVLNYIEKKFDFKLSRVIYIFLISCYLLIQFSVLNYVKLKTKQVEDLQKIINNKNILLNSVNEINNSNLSINYIDSIWKNIKSNNELNKDINTISSTLYNRFLNSAKNNITNGDFGSAIQNLNFLVKNELSNSEIYYLLGSSYLAINNKIEAIYNFKISSNLGNSKATELYETLNPLKKKISYYVTLCCDGSYSYSVGRGTCSWHGGVCQWNYPVYKEYREY